MEHRTALALAGAVVMVGGSGAFTVGALTGAVGPDADDLPDVSPTTVGAADGRHRAVRDKRPPVERVTRYVDVPVPARGPAAVAPPAAVPAPPVGAAAQPPSTGVVAADPGAAEVDSEAAEEQAELAEERAEERHEALEERREERRDLREDLREEELDGDGDSDGGGDGHG